MTEIRIDTDLPHPPERVWKAVTDPRVLREWFMETTITARSEGVATAFTLTPDGDDGFDDPVTGEIVEVECGRKLGMLWVSTQMHTQVTVVLQPGGSGCHLGFVQRGFLGQQGTLRRRVLQRTYTQMFAEGLRAALKRLEAVERERGRDNLLRRGADAAGHPGWRPVGQRAGGQRSVVGNEARFFAGVPRQASMAWEGIKAAGRNMSRRSSAPTARTLKAAPQQREPVRGVAPPAGEALSDSLTTALSQADWSRRGRLEVPDRDGHQRRIAVIASVSIVALLATLAVLVGRLIEPGAAGTSLGPGDQRSVLDPGGVVRDGGAASKASASKASGQTSAPTAAPTTSAASQRTTSVLGATYRTNQQVVGGYEGIILVHNLSNQAVRGWSVTIVLPPLGLVVHDVRGAFAEQADREIRFSPMPETRVVPAGDSVRFTFQVQGVGAPVACVIEGRSCAGVPA